MLTLRSYSLFFRCFNFVLVSCVSFGIKANIDLFDLKHPTVNPELEKITTKKKKKSLHCVFSMRELFLSFFLLGPRKLPFSCPTTKTHKINTHRRGTQQPPATSRCKAQHLTSLTSRQNPKPNSSPSTTADAKARDEQPPLLHASCRHCLPVFALPPGVSLQRRPRTLIAKTASVSSLISFEFC